MFSSFELLTYHRLPKSTYAHAMTRVASVESEVLAVGSQTHAKAEILDLSVNRWVSVPDYPFTEVVFNVPLTTYRGAFIVFGNSIDTTVAQFKLNQWTKLGEMNYSRRGHGAVMIGTHDFMLVG